MPQLNPEFFISQLFWLFISFSFLLFFLWKISLPRISIVLEKRETKINNDIQSAKKLQNEAEKIQIEISQQLKTARSQASELIKESTINFHNKTLSQLQVIDSEIEKKIDKSTKIIQKNMDDSIHDMKHHIQDITKLTLLKLSKIKVTDQEISDAISTTQNKLIDL